VLSTALAGCGPSGCGGVLDKTIDQNNNDGLQCNPSRGAGATGDGGHAVCSDLPDFGLSCEEDFFQANAASDIIWVVDNSGSMTEENESVQRNIAQFSQVMAATNVDFKLVMVSNQKQGPNPVCVPEPLASANCENSANFLRVEAEVQSTNGPTVLLYEYDHNLGFPLFMRPDSKRSIVFVTDDNYEGTSASFLAEINTRDGLRGATIHSVVGTDSAMCPDIATQGTEYLKMSNETGGLILPICCSDYNALVNTLANDIAAANGRYVLERQAIATSVRVYVLGNTLADGGTAPDGGTVRTPVRAGWTYDAALHAVQFEASARPAEGTRLVITYSVH
jgi:hypothetical protein